LIDGWATDHTIEAIPSLRPNAHVPGAECNQCDYEAERTLDPPTQPLEPPRQEPFRLVVNVVVVGLFKEEEKGIVIASDIIT